MGPDKRFVAFVQRAVDEPRDQPLNTAVVVMDMKKVAHVIYSYTQSSNSPSRCSRR